MFAAELGLSADQSDAALRHYEKSRATVAQISEPPRWLGTVIEKAIRRSGLDLDRGKR